MAENSSPPLRSKASYPPPSFKSEKKKAAHGHTSYRKRKMRVESTKQKPKTPIGVLCSWLFEHQVGVAVNLLMLLALVHICFPRARSRTRKFFEMSGYRPADKAYIQTWDDGYYIFFWTVIFTGLRVVTMDFLLRPLIVMTGIRSPKAQTRFAEQGWLFLYYSASWAMGMYIYANSSYWLDLSAMWADFPTRTVSPLVKWYYLAQTGFWLQQIIVVNIEERRDDYWQMFAHHIFTSALLLSSYGFYQTKVGNVILCIMDLVDIILPLAKMLNYLRFQAACDIAFGLFLITWLLTRHVAFPLVCWSIWAQVAQNGVMPYGCYDTSSSIGTRISRDGGSAVWANIVQAFAHPDGVVCFNRRIQLGFFALLMALQALTLIWFATIVRIAYAVVSGRGAQDARSDDEASEPEPEGEGEGDGEADDDDDVLDPVLEESPAVLVPLNKEDEKERERDVEEPREPKRMSPGPSSGRSGRRRGRGRGARASGISIAGHSDHKELLGRIGCDKPT